MKILDCQPDDEHEGNMYEFFEIRCQRELIPEVVKRLQRADGIGELELNIKPKAGLITGSLRTLRCNLCRHFTGKGCFLGSAVYNVDQDRIIWSFYIRDKYLSQLLDALSSEGVEFRVEEVTSVQDVYEGLTARQEALLMTALREGYFDTPRRTDSRRLAEELGLSPPALSVSLRRAIKRILSEYLTRENRLSQRIKTENQL